MSLRLLMGEKHNQKKGKEEHPHTDTNQLQTISILWKIHLPFSRKQKAKEILWQF